MTWWHKRTVKPDGRLAILGDGEIVVPKNLTRKQAGELRAKIAESLKKCESIVVLPPAFSPRHVYGGKGTVNRTSTIDVVLDDKGNVSQVWFRCLELPFTVDRRDHDPGYYNPGDDGYERRIAIEEVTYVDLPSEESSQ